MTACWGTDIIQSCGLCKDFHPASPPPDTAMRLALYEPDIPQNTGAMLRLAACLGLSVDLIEPCGFIWSDRKLRRAGMDYLEGVDLTRHSSWSAYRTARAGAGRLVLLTTRGD